MMRKILSVAAGLVLGLTGCANQNVADYASLEPKIDVREYLNGDIEAWGVLFDWQGQQNTRFHVKMKGTWQGNSGTLQEYFTYDDGRTQERIWTINVSDDNNFTATAADVIGTAVGQQQGNAANMKYTLRVQRGDGSIDLSMDDWLYKVDDKTVVNRATMRKFGIKVGELMLVFRKP